MTAMLEPPFKIPYGPDNDKEAREFIGRQVSHPSRRAWAELLSHDRAGQTVRALTWLVNDLQAQVQTRKAAFDTTLADHQAGRINDVELSRLRMEYEEWRGRVGFYRSAAIRRLNEAKAARRQANVAISRAEQREQDREFRNILAVLVEAVQKHQADTEREVEPTEFDRALWARLSLLQTPSGAPLIDLTKRRQIADGARK